MSDQELIKTFTSELLGNELVISAYSNPFLSFIGKLETITNDNSYIFICSPYLFNNNEIRAFTPTQAQIAFLLIIKDICAKQLTTAVDWEKFAQQFVTSKFITVESNVDDEYGITISNTDGNVVWCNTTFEKQSERTLSEIVGKRPRNAIYGNHSVYIDNNFVDDNVKKGEPFYFENIGTSKTGKEFWFGATVQPLFDLYNNIVGRIHFMKDIHNRKVKELELEENENLLTLAVEAAKAGLWAYDIVSGDFKVSQEYKKILGYDYRYELTYEQMVSQIHPDDALYLTTQIHPNLNIDNPSFIFEHRVMVNGTYRYFNAKANCIKFTENGAPTKIVGTLRDVTIEKEQILELEHQKQFYHKILDELPADVVLLNTQHKYQFINKTAVKNDAIREWMIGKDDFEYCAYRKIDPSVAETRRAQFNMVMTSKKTCRFIEKKETAEGEQHIMRMFYPKLDDQGEVELIIGYALDISEQVQNEQYAQAQERRMKTILDISSDGIFRCNPNGDVTMGNASFFKILDKKDSDKVNIFDKVSDANKLKFIEQSELAINTGVKQTGIFILKNKKNEEERHIEYNLTRTVNSKISSFSGRISDITEIVMKEKNLQKAIDEEMQLSKYKTQFIHISSHELRTPLTIIQANAELLQMCMANPELQKKKDPSVLSGRIVKEVEVMTEILNQLMMVSKIETGNIELEKKNTDIKQFIKNDLINMFSPYTDGRSVIVNIADDVSMWNIDAKILRHALLNLLSNAFKYSYNRPAPTLTVKKSEGNLIFSVEDNGIGIPDEDRQKLFQSFFRASNVGVISGTGIGLMVVEYAVKKHNGTISIASKINEGSTFSISLPQ